ncbi:MAG: HAMP domain-containing histidine kinase [Proteobacteria bacterium]|nr:HAMP domain-containing histidine kinase [Pseudomonadota bacterium]MBS0216733.1 HAMP domain-containing histidine kinase [Pseudomonadota bacterium]
MATWPWRSTSRRLALMVSAAFLLAFMLLGAGVYFGVSVLLEKDSQDVLRLQTAGLVEVARSGGLPALREEVRSRTEQPDDPDSAYALWDANGRLLAGTALPLPAGGMPTAVGASHSYEFIDDDTDDDANTMAHATPLGDGSVLVVALHTRAQDGFRSLMLRASIAALIAAGVLGVLLGWLIMRLVASRLRALDIATERITAGDMTQRVRVDGSGDAFDRLAQRFNSMLDRIGGLMAGVRAATDHIAHDLRTPLTRLRNRLDDLREDAEPGSSQRTSLDTAVNDTDQLLGTFAGLLRLSRIEAQSLGLDAPRVALWPLLEDAQDMYAPIAAERGIRIELGGDAADAQGDADQLFQMVLNLLDNAIKYTPDGSVVQLAVRPQGPVVVIDVADQGAGIPEEDRLRVFDRFERLEAHRGSPGSGLGLSLVRAIANRHGGRIELRDHHPGLLVRVTLPRAVA